MFQQPFLFQQHFPTTCPPWHHAKNSDHTITSDQNLTTGLTTSFHERQQQISEHPGLGQGRVGRVRNAFVKYILPSFAFFELEMAAQVLHIIELQLGLDGLCEENIIFNVPHQLLKHEVTPFVLL